MRGTSIAQTGLMLQKHELTSTHYTYSPCGRCGLLNRVALEHSGHPVCGSCKSDLPLDGGINEVSGAGLAKLIEKSPVPIVADFWAPWCGPCRTFAPVFDRASRELAGEVVFARLNTEAHPIAAGAYGIRGIPTLIVFKAGIEADRKSGALPFESFVGWMRTVLR